MLDTGTFLFITGEVAKIMYNYGVLIIGIKTNYQHIAQIQKHTNQPMSTSQFPSKVKTLKLAIEDKHVTLLSEVYYYYYSEFFFVQRQHTNDHSAEFV